MLRSGYLGFGVPTVGKVLGTSKPPNRGVARGFLAWYLLMRRGC